MTEQGKIDRKGARPASLFERADAAFGLDPRGGGVKLPGVPETLRRAPEPAPAPAPRTEAAAARVPLHAQPAPAPTPQPAAAPAPEPVAFCGPHAAIDRDHLRNGGLIVPEDPVTALLEEFRIVKRELLADARAGATALARRILVCSPHSGEGKTYCATNLAIALAAERDLEVLLVDADVVNPSVTRRLGISAERGLMDALADPAILPESLVIRTDIDGLFVLPAGTASARDAEWLASARTGEVLGRGAGHQPHRASWRGRSLAGGGGDFAGAAGQPAVGAPAGHGVLSRALRR